MDEHKTISEVAGVTASKPADPVGILALRERRRGCVRIRPVAEHVLNALDPNLANLTVGEVLAGLGIDDPDLDVTPRLTR